jgi:hypothetical protein
VARFVDRFAVKKGTGARERGLKPISTLGSRLMSQPTAPAQDAAICTCAKTLMRVRSILVAPNSLTVASNSTLLCVRR